MYKTQITWLLLLLKTHYQCSQSWIMPTGISTPFQILWTNCDDVMNCWSMIPAQWTTGVNSNSPKLEIVWSGQCASPCSLEKWQLDSWETIHDASPYLILLLQPNYIQELALHRELWEFGIIFISFPTISHYPIALVTQGLAGAIEHFALFRSRSCFIYIFAHIRSHLQLSHQSLNFSSHQNNIHKYVVCGRPL